MDKSVKTPLFIIAEDNTVQFLQELWEVDCCGMEPIDVADGVYTAYDSEGQILKLVTINEKGEVERPTENTINISFLGKIVSVAHDKTIKALPLEVKDTDKLTKVLTQDLSRLGHHVDGLTLEQLISIYQEKHKKV